MAGGIDKRAIRQLFRDLQKEFDRNGPIQVPIGVDKPGSRTSVDTATIASFDSWAPRGSTGMDAQIVLLMDWLFVQGGAGHTFHHINKFIENTQYTETPSESLLLGKHLEESGFADVAFTFGGASACLNGRGISRVEEIHRMRADRSLRAADLQRQMLRWLHDQEDRNAAPDSWASFLARRPFTRRPSHLLGEPFTEAEVHRQASYLQERGLLTSVQIEEESPGWLRPRLTVDGNECVTSYQGVVTDFMDRRRAGGDNFYGPVIHGNADGAQLAWGNQAVHQTQNQQIAPGFEAIAQSVADTLSQIPRLGMSEEERGDAEAVANEILAEVVAPSPDRGKLRRAYAALKGFLIPIAAGVSAGAGEGAQELARQAIENLSSVTF